jgi:hypothetical protein
MITALGSGNPLGTKTVKTTSSGLSSPVPSWQHLPSPLMIPPTTGVWSFPNDLAASKPCLGLVGNSKFCIKALEGSMTLCGMMRHGANKKQIQGGSGRLLHPSFGLTGLLQADPFL